MRVNILHPKRSEFLTCGYLVLIPLGREHTATLRIKVGTVGRAAPVGERTTRVVIHVSVADEIRFAVQGLEAVASEQGTARNVGGTYVDGTGHVHVGVE